MKNKSFTLIELLVVIVIIGILAGVIMISTSSSIDKANIAKLKVFEESIKNDMLMNLVSEWKFDEGSATIAKDTWGSNQGSLYNFASPATFTSGWASENDCATGTCLKFDGIDDYVDCGSLTIGPDADFTYSLWVKPDKDKVWNFAIGGASQYNYSLYMGRDTSNYQPWFYLSYEGSVSRTLYGNAWSHSNWHYLVLTRSEDTFEMYQDAIFTKDYTYNTLSSLTHPYIGRSGNADRTGAGLIDDICIYNIALSSAQIKQNYIAGLDSLLSNGNISKEDYNKRINELAYE